MQRTIAVDLDKMAEEVAEKALDEFTYNGKTIREWVEIIVAQDLLAITELEKIKANIDDLDRHFDNDYFSGNKEPMFKCNEVFEILDKRIAELKGENNEHTRDIK